MDRLRMDRFASLVKGAAAVVAESDLEQLLQMAVQLAQDTTDARYAALGVVGEHGMHTEFHHVGFDPETVATIGHPPIGKGVLGTLIRQRRPIRVTHLSDHPDSSGFPQGHPAMDSFLGVPIRAGDAVFGNFYLTEKDGGFTEDDELLIEALAAVVGSAVSAVRLRERLTRLAVVEDRERIARDLHDAVIQDLFAVGLSLQGIMLANDDPQVIDRLDDAINRIDDSIATLRSFIFDLRSLGAALADPERTLRRIVERLLVDRSIAASVSVGDLRAPAPERLDDAFQVVRESVSNAVRHGRPSTITVRLARDGDGLVASVIDDGDGFMLDEVERGMGLDNLSERVSRIGGHLTVESAPGVGTTVTAVIPTS